VEVTTFIWMFVVLKVPIAALLALVWWAVREPEPVLDVDEDDGGSRRPEPHRGPRAPRPPRRGPHAGDPPPPPRRVRTPAIARGARASH
jgi:hypothetical protein